MAAILDSPVPTVGGKNTLGVGLLWGSAGGAVGNVMREFPGLFIYELPLDEESLSGVGKVEGVVEFGRGPDLRRFDPPMVRRRIIYEILKTFNSPPRS